jgi:myosin heavy subunit
MEDNVLALPNHQVDWKDAIVGDPVYVSDDVEPYASCRIELIKDRHTLILHPNDPKKPTFKVNTEEYVEFMRKGAVGPEPKRLLPKAKKAPAHLKLRGVKDFHDNLDELSPLNEAELLRYLKNQFRVNNIYTRTGSTLVALNPFKWMLSAYTVQVVNKYHAGVSDDDAAPHIYQEAEAVLRSVHEMGDPAHFVITGCSGSGKTESAKLLFQYFAETSKIDQQVTGATREGGPLGGRELPCLDDGKIDKLLSAIDVLESLGHAKTLENENSSRFGWFAKLYFNGNMVLDGCHIDTMFLETSRVVAPKMEERNFHVFYQLLRGLDPGLKQALATQQVSSYDILHTGSQDVQGFNDSEEWQMFLDAMFSIGLSDDEVVSGVTALLVAILDIGNLDFDEAGLMTDKEARDTVCDGLGILNNAEDFEKLIRGEEVEHAAAFASRNRDLLSKKLYGKLFDHAVARLNNTFAPDFNAGGGTTYVSILDMPGFENLHENGLDQLLFNLASEQLQETFFSSRSQEAKMYVVEGASFGGTPREFPTCKYVIDTLSSPTTGALSLLANAVNSDPPPTDEEYVKLLARYQENNQCFAECGPRSPWKVNGVATTEHHFGILHYGGTVIYDASSFVERNQAASINEDLCKLFAASTNPLVAEFFKESSSQEAEPTEIANFNSAIENILSVVSPREDVDLHYICCIRSNHEAKPDMLDRSFVLEQINLCGINAALAERCHGLSYYMSYPHFSNEFDYFLRDDLNDEETMLGRAYKVAVKGYLAIFDEVESIERRSTLLGHHQTQRKKSSLGEKAAAAAAAVLASAEADRDAFTQMANFEAGDAILFNRVEVEGAVGGGKWEKGVYVKRENEDKHVISVSSDNTELTLGVDRVCRHDHFFLATHTIMGELASKTHITAQDYRLGKTKIFLNSKAMRALQGVVHDVLNYVAGRIQRFWLKRSKMAAASLALEVVQTMLRVVQNSAKKAGVSNHPSFSAGLIGATKAIAYATSVAKFDDSTSEHALEQANKEIASLTAIERKLADDKARAASQRNELLRSLDDYEARLRIVEKSLRHDVVVPKEKVERLIPRVREELDGHRTHLDALMAQRSMALSDLDTMNGTVKKMARRSAFAVDSLMALMGAEDFSIPFTERRDAVVKLDNYIVEVEDAFRVVQEEQHKFDLSKRSATANLKNAEIEFVKLVDKIDEAEISEAASVMKSMRMAQEAIANAQISLLAEEPAEFEIACQKASDQVGDLSEVVVRERQEKDANSKIVTGRDILSKSANMFREIETDAEILGISYSSFAYINAHALAAKVLADVADSEVKNPDKYIEYCQAFVNQVRHLEVVFRREKAAKEAETMERSEEMERLRPAVERLNELQAHFESSGIPNYERVQEAILKALSSMDNTRLALDEKAATIGDSKPIRSVREMVRESIQLVVMAERTFNEEVDRKVHLERETTAASEEIESVEQRLDAVASEIEASGITVAHLAEESYSEAENAVANAKKLLRKGASPGEIRNATQAAIDAVRSSEDSLERHKARLLQVQKMRDAEQSRLDGGTKLLSQVTELCDEVGLTDGSASEVTDLLLAAKSSIRLAQARLGRPLSVAWLENNEITGDQAVVKEALARVDDVEEQVYKEKALLEKLDRESRVNVQLLELGVEKFESLHSMALDEGLASDVAVQTALEEADDAMSFAKKAQATASKAHVLSSRKHIDSAVVKVAHCEEVLFAAKSRRDKSQRGKQDAAAKLERVMADMHAVVATIDAAGPTVSAMMEDYMDLAAKAVNVAVRHLRNDKDLSVFKGHIEHATEVVMQMDDQASKVRMQATKAEKLKLSALKQLETLAATLHLVSEKADSDQLRGTVGVAGLIQTAEATLNMIRRRTDVSIEVWMQDANAMQRGIVQAVDAVQKAEEAVEDESGKKDRKRKMREKMKMELNELHDQLAIVRDQIETVGGISTVAVIQQALTAAENELDSVLHQFQGGSATMISVASTAEAIHHLQELADTESRKRDQRNVEIQAALRALPILQQQLAAVEAMVESAGPPVGILVEPDMTNAMSAVIDLERFVDSGHNYTKKHAPSVMAVTDKCQALEDLATRQVKRVNAAYQAMSHEARRLDELQSRFSEVCELVAAFCSRSDHLRIQMEAEWQDICWWGSQVRHTKTTGGPYGRGELKPIGTVEMITDHMTAADKSLAFARKRVEMSIEHWLENGPSAAHSAVDEAALKVETAQQVVDKEHTRLEYEEKLRANGMGELKTHADRLGSIRALMEDNQLTSHVLCKDALRQAEHACAVVGELYGKGPVNSAHPAMEVAIRKVSDVHDMVVAEAQRRERNLAEKAHAASQLDEYRAALQAVQDTHAALGMGDVAYVADAVNRASQALREAELLVSAESVGLSLIGRATSKVQGLLEVAERAVGQQKKRQEELTRFKFTREEVTAHRRLRRDYKDKMKARAEQGERLRMNAELNAESIKMQAIMSCTDDVTHASRLAEVSIEAARIAIDHASLSVAQTAVREAQVKIHYALHYARSADLAAGPAIAGRQLADSDYKERFQAAVQVESRSPSRSMERGVSVRSAVEAAEHRESCMAQLEANILAGVGDREAQLRQLQDLQLPIVSNRYGVPGQHGSTTPPSQRLFPAGRDPSLSTGEALASTLSRDPAIADYRSENYYGSQGESAQPITASGDMSSMFPDFPSDCTSLLATHLSKDLFSKLSKLSTSSGVTLQDCIISGVEFPENPVGLFAGDAESLVVFEPLFEPVVSDLHAFSLDSGIHPASELDAGNIPDLPQEGVVSAKCKFTRNIAGLSLTPQMTVEQRRDVELTIAGVFAAFEGTDFAATRYNLSDCFARPEVRSRCTAVSPTALPVNNDPFKDSAGVYDTWPQDRAVFIGDDDSFVAVVNGEEHMVLYTTHQQSLIEAFNAGADLLDNIANSKPASADAVAISYEYNSKFGFVTADPALLGTAMELEVTVNAPGGLGSALKAGRLATTCSTATLDSVDIIPSLDGTMCTIKSVRTVGVTVLETLEAVTEATLALLEAVKDA